MSTLLLDAGNTRIKWIFAEDLGRMPASAWTDGDAWPPAWSERPIAAIWLSSVRAEAVDADLCQRLYERYGYVVRRAHSTASACGVVNAYRQPERLGVDRWLALLAAAARPGAALVIDAGTALTIDALDAQGRHLGGRILPGQRLMIDALHRHTAQVRVATRLALPLVAGFADHTEAAVLQGVSSAQRGAVLLAYEQMRSLCPEQELRVLLTGGDSGALSDLFPAAQVEQDPDLVLRGLWRWGHDCDGERAVPI